MVQLKKFLGLMLVVSFTAILNSCFEVPDKLIVPQWSVDVNIPLLNRTFTLQSIIKSDPNIFIDTVNGKPIYILQSDTYSLQSGVDDYMQVHNQNSLQGVPMPAALDSVLLYVEFPDGIELDSALFIDGILSFSIQNPSRFDADVEILFPGLITPSGIKLAFDLTINANNFDSIYYSLANHSYMAPPTQPIEKRNSLQAIIKINSLQPQQTILYSNFYLKDFYFKSVSGLIPARSLGSQQESFKFQFDSVDNYQNKITLREAELKLTATYTSPANDPIGVEIYNLVVVGMRNSGEYFYLRDSLGSIYHTLKFDDVFTQKIYNEQNSNIDEFVTFFPDTVLLRAEYLMNPDSVRGTVTNVDIIKLETDFSTRSLFSFNEIKIDDESSIEINEEDRRLMRRNSSAELTLEFENALPLGAWVKMDLFDSYNNYLFTITKDEYDNDSVYFKPAVVDANGEVISPVENDKLKFSLNTEEIKMLSNAYVVYYTIYLSTSETNNPGNPTVAVRPSSWIKVKAYGSLKFDSNDED